MADIDVKAARERLGWTQEELANRLGCSSRAVSGWERGEHRPLGVYRRRLLHLLRQR